MNLTASGVSLLVAAVALSGIPVAAQTQPPLFRSSVDVVSVTAVVRDRHNKIVPALGPADLQVLDAGEVQPVLALTADRSAAASVALLMDGSGSMAISHARQSAVRIADAILATLDTARDEAAVLTFDRRLLTLQDFTGDFAAVHGALGRVESFGSTSLYDAVAGAAGSIADRTQRRRAVIVFTDGADTGSHFSPAAVSSIASSIDVPVYVFVLGDSAGTNSTRSSHLAEIARETGGALFPANTSHLIDAGIRTVVEELRHQYVLSFKANPFDGLRRLEVRTTRKDLRVRSRAWYFAGE